MTSKSIINIVATECPVEIEDKFNHWHDAVHLPMMLKVPGAIGATRYRAINPTTGDQEWK